MKLSSICFTLNYVFFYALIYFVYIDYLEFPSAIGFLILFLCILSGLIMSVFHFYFMRITAPKEAK